MAFWLSSLHRRGMSSLTSATKAADSRPADWSFSVSWSIPITQPRNFQRPFRFAFTCITFPHNLCSQPTASFSQPCEHNEMAIKVGVERRSSVEHYLPSQTCSFNSKSLYSQQRQYIHSSAARPSAMLPLLNMKYSRRVPQRPSRILASSSTRPNSTSSSPRCSRAPNHGRTPTTPCSLPALAP